MKGKHREYGGVFSPPIRTLSADELEFVGGGCGPGPDSYRSKSSGGVDNHSKEMQNPH